MRKDKQQDEDSLVNRIYAGLQFLYDNDPGPGKYFDEKGRVSQEVANNVAQYGRMYLRCLADKYPDETRMKDR